MRTKRIKTAAIAGVCVTLLFPGTLTASPEMYDQEGGNAQSGPASATASNAQPAAQQNANAASTNSAPAKNGSLVCPVTADTAPPVSPPLAAALALYRIGKFDEAIAAYNAILPTGGSEAAAAYAGLARVYLEKGNTNEAYAVAQKAVALTPDRAPAIVALGEVYFRQGKLTEAQVAFSKPLRACDLDARAFLGLSRLYTVSLNWKRAITNIDQAYKLDPDDPEIRRHYMGTVSAPGQKPANACRLATNLKSTEAKFEPLSDRPNHVRGYGLNVKVNGISSRLLFDTGASGILIDRKIGDRAGVKSIKDIEIHGFGDTGPTAGFVGHADKIQIGELEFDDCLVQVAAGGSVMDGDGLIGADVFRHFLVDIYMPAHKLKLGELPPYPDEPAGEVSLDSHDSQQPHRHDRYLPPGMEDFTPIFEFGHDLLIPTSVNSSSPRLFLIDTGAFDNNLSLAYAKEVTKVSSEYDAEVKGLSGKVKKVYSAQNATIQFANIKQQREDLITTDMTHISDLSGTEVSGVLGFAMLWMLDIKIDYRDGLVKFTVESRFVQ
ncbi:MAG: aspartyl protease family protein [Candidatus Acidiferrales bacterium]